MDARRYCKLQEAGGRTRCHCVQEVVVSKVTPINFQSQGRETNKHQPKRDWAIEGSQKWNKSRWKTNIEDSFEG